MSPSRLAPTTCLLKLLSRVSPSGHRCWRAHEMPPPSSTAADRMADSTMPIVRSSSRRFGCSPAAHVFVKRLARTAETTCASISAGSTYSAGSSGSSPRFDHGELPGSSMMFTRFRAHVACLALIPALVLPAVMVSGQTPARDRQASGKGFIWKFEREGRTGWLVGSLHLLSADFYPLPESMNQAFAGAETLVEEIDMDEASNPAFAAMVLSKAMFPTGTTLSTSLSPATYKILAAWLSKNGLAVEAFQQMKPWMVSLTLQTLALQRIGFDPAFGIDKHFADNAQKSKKQFLALETAAEQIDFLDRLSPRTQDLMLRESLESADAELAEIKAIASAWKVGDVAAVEKLALSSLKDSPEVYQSLLVDRNRRWVPKIETCTQTSRCFVVVGAAHLVGADGLIALLKQKGYTVEQQ